MIKTIIIEDEVNVRNALRKMLTILEPSINVIAETGYVNDAVKLIKTKKPDLVFLDIELEDGTGFDVLKQLEGNFSIIFTTAYNQYAINAFKFSAIDYLLKPLDPTELQAAISRAKQRIKNEKEYKELLNSLLNNIEKKEKKIVLKTTEQHFVFYVKEIIRLEADGAYTIFVTKKQKIIISRNIKYYQDILGDDFIRCHQSHLVNSKHILGIDKKGLLQLSNNELIVVSTRKKSEVIRLINKK